MMNRELTSEEKKSDNLKKLNFMSSMKVTPHHT